MAVRRIEKKPPRNLLDEMAAADEAPVNVIQRQGEAQIPKLLERIAELEDEREQLLKQNEQLQFAQADTTDTEAIADLKARNEELQQRLQALQQKQREDERRIAELTQEVEASRRQTEAEFAARCKELEDENAALSSRQQQLLTDMDKALKKAAKLEARLAELDLSASSTDVAPHELYGFEPCQIDPDEWARKVQNVANTYVKPLNARYDTPAALVLGELSHAFYTFGDTQADNASYVRVAVALVHPLLQKIPYFRERIRTRILTLRAQHGTEHGVFPSAILEQMLREAYLGVISEQLEMWERALDWLLAAGAMEVVRPPSDTLPETASAKDELSSV